MKMMDIEEDASCRLPVDSTRRLSDSSTQASTPRNVGFVNSRVHVCCEMSVPDDNAIDLRKVRAAGESWLSSAGLTVTMGRHDPRRINNTIINTVCRDIMLEYAIPDDLIDGGGNGNKAGSEFIPAVAQKCASSVEANPLIVPQCRISIDLLVYRLFNSVLEADMTDDDEAGVITAYKEWAMPNTEFHGLWDSLFFDSAIKAQLLRYATTALLFSDRGVNSKLISWNHLILLHGPPGTGKTSLCKALAQKLAVRLANRYSSARMLEINSHSLFSRWFSESGKLVMKLFATIREILEDSSCLVVVLIDEVESLSAARNASAASTEPSDSIRVVNALLTQIDTMKAYPNALVITTSNITESCDSAFVDRADLKLYIPNPSPQCRYEILRGCIAELMRTGLLCSSDTTSSYEQLVERRHAPSDQITKQFLAVVDSSSGTSGRTLRKLPFLAYSRLSGAVSTVGLCDSSRPNCITLTDFLSSLSTTITCNVEAEASVSAGSKLHARPSTGKPRE